MSLKHYLEKRAVYYVTSVTKNRKLIFTDITVVRFLLVTIAYHKYILEFNLFGYVIMPDHFHILVQPIDTELPIIMRYIKGNFARKYNRWLIDIGNISSNISSRHLSADYKRDKDKKYRDYNDKRKEYIGLNKSGGHLYKSVWQEGYYETIMRSEKEIMNRLNYIHNNPVRKGLVNEPSEYEFSSYHQYYGKIREKIQIPIDKIW